VSRQDRGLEQKAAKCQSRTPFRPVERPPGAPRHRRGLDWERAAIVKLAEEWGEIDRSHPQLGHRGSRLGIVHVSESTVLRALVAEGIQLPAPERREPRSRGGLAGVGRAGARGDLDLRLHAFCGPRGRARSRSSAWSPATSCSAVVSAEESSTQVEVAFIDELVADGKEHLLDADLLAELRGVRVPDDDDRLPVLLALSDNGPQTANTILTSAAIRPDTHLTAYDLDVAVVPTCSEPTSTDWSTG
jgi:putative transposase